MLKAGFLYPVQEISFNGNSKIYIDLNDPEPRNVYLKGEFDPFFFNVASTFLKSGSHFFDIGSNVGFCSFGLTFQVSTSVNFHLFEANKNLFSLLLKSRNLYPNWNFSINNVCVSDKFGDSSFSVVEEQTGQSYVSENSSTNFKINNLLIDEYCIKRNIKTIDFMKLDIEGYELNALKGASTLLKNKQIKSIYIEIIPENLNRYKLTHIDILNYLEKFDYNFYFCKSEDKYLLKKDVIKFRNLELLPFNPIEYPVNYSTDILSLPKNKEVSYGN